MPTNHKTELKRRDSLHVSPATTVEGEIGSWIAQTLQQYPDAKLNDDVANSELDASVDKEKHTRKARKRAPLPLGVRPWHQDASPPFPMKSSFKPAIPSTRTLFATSGVRSPSGTFPSGALSSYVPSSGAHLKEPSSLFAYSSGFCSSRSCNVRPTRSGGSSKIYSTQGACSSGLHPSASHRNLGSATGPGAGRASATSLNRLPLAGLNQPHIDEKAAVVGYFFPTSAARSFHPNQYAHALIANLVMYTMAARNAASLGVTMQPEQLTDLGSSCPLPPSPACSGSAPDTWSSKDAVVSAASSFCNDFQNVGGASGTTTSATFNPNSLDYLSVSIAWNDDFTIGENQCNNWFDTVISGCDTYSSTLKHGGSIGFATNASLMITPLVVRSPFNGGQVNPPQCNALSNNHYATYSTLLGNIQNFCAASVTQKIANAGTTFTKDYNGGTPDHLTLTTTWPPGPRNFEVFEDECNYYLKTVMNSCDIPSPASNPLNWKHGGSIADHNNVLYTISPIPDRAPAPDKPVGNCWSWWKGIFASFDVYGGGFASGDFGQSSVLTQLRGCGALTNWGFEYYQTAAADGTEWHAWGRLPIGTRACVGRAVESAGGYSGWCSGNG